MNYDVLTHKKQQLDVFRPLPPALVRNLDEWFKVELTYSSNAIEGNTLTRREIAVVIEKGLTIGGKSLKEHLEATNHAAAIDFLYFLVGKQPSQLTEKDILAIHNIVLRGINDQNAGHYRNIAVRISGAAVILPNPRKVPDLMDDFQAWLTSKPDLHPVAFAGEAHYRLVTIHPFVDGNGRTARLLMNLLLIMVGYPPAIIRKRDRLVYIAALEKAQFGGSRIDFDNIIIKAAMRSLDIYLNAANGETGSIEDSDLLLKIGELAKTTEQTVATIRHWTELGLLEVAEITKSGYQLYSIDMIKRCQHIKKLKEARLSLAEIKMQII